MINEKKLMIFLKEQHDKEMNKYKIFDDEMSCGAMHAYDNVVDYVMEQPKVGEWIPVSEQLPAPYETVLATGKGEAIGKSLLSRIQLLEAARTIKDIVVMPTLNFHDLKGKDKGKFAIDVKNRREPWRLILEPLDENNERFNPCNIDEIASRVEKVLIVEVSKHYE